MEKIEPAFISCSSECCRATPANIEKYNSIILRISFFSCYRHITDQKINTIILYIKSRIDFSRITVIFYNIKLSKNGQIEQLSAFLKIDNNFSIYTGITIKINISLNLKKLLLILYNTLVFKFRNIIKKFIK